MKRKKGFTLIELIVVIAIIGVLSAILVPMITGYIKKARLRSADNSADLIMKAANSALVGLSEIDCDFSTNRAYHHIEGYVYTDPVTPVPDAADTLYSYMELYFDELTNTEFSIYVHDGVCVAAAAEKSGYYGTSPKVYTAHNYDKSRNAPADAKEALDDAIDKYNEFYPGVINNNANPGT